MSGKTFATSPLIRLLRGPCFVSEYEGEMIVAPMRFIPVRSHINDDFSVELHCRTPHNSTGDTAR